MLRKKKTRNKSLKPGNTHSDVEPGSGGVVLDITEQLRNERRDLEKERNFISAILETTGALVVVFDPQGRFIRINEAFETITGFSILDIVGKYFWDELLDSEDKGPMEQVFQKIINGEFPLEYRSHVLTKEGKTRTVIWSLTALKQDEQLEYIIGSGIDITELQKALADIRILSGLMPICSHCKKVRDDTGYWNQIEEYIARYSDAAFSHSLCPDCAREYYPKFYKDK